MKKAFGPSVIKIFPLKSTMEDVMTPQQVDRERWAEHYRKLYSKENIVTRKAIENTTPLPTMEELDFPPTIEELGKAID